MAHRVNADKVIWRVVDGEAVLLHADTSAYYGMNQVGTILWEALVSQSLDSDDLLAWARRQFPDAPEEIAGDIAEFLAHLEGFDLLETSPNRQINEAVGPTPASVKYEPPQITPFGELEKLILSGE